MPQQTKSSISTKARPSKAKQVTLAAAEKKGFKCDIDGCKASFRNQTDVSRHKWVHLPVHLRPTCPFEGHYGYHCSEPYTGRAEHIKIHWMKEHPEAGPYPAIKWPKLNEILSRNHIKLGKNNPRVFTPLTSHSPSPAPSLELVSDIPSPAENYYYYNMPQSLNQHGYPIAQGYNPQLVPFYGDPQGFFQPAIPNFNYPVAFPPQHQYMAAPMHPTFGNASQPTFSGQYVPKPFEMQVEDMGFDVSLVGVSPDDLQTHPTNEEWNGFVRGFPQGEL